MSARLKIKDLRLKFSSPKSGAFARRFTRSKAGNFFYFLFLIGAGLFSVLPLIYCISTSFKPIDELLKFPPNIFVVNRPTMQNYLSLPNLLSNLKIPLSRYVFNSLFVSVATTAMYVIIAAMAAFALAKSKIKIRKVYFNVVQ